MNEEIKEELKQKQKLDPLKPQAELDSDDMGVEFSPMSPPDAYKPPSSEKVPYEDMHPFLQHLTDEHVELKALIEGFNSALKHLKEKKPQTPEINQAIENFFLHFENDFHEHNRKEERALFPLLHKYLLESGEHSPTDEPITGINLLEDEHIEISRLVTMTYQLFQLSQCPFEKEAREKLFEFAIVKGFELVEAINLHIFREDEIIFGLAHRLIESGELDRISEISTLKS
jgi:hemerythrin-like domain-containing protein